MAEKHNWIRLLSYVTGLVNQELLLRNEYLVAENRILKGQIKGRLRLSHGERSNLAEIGKRLGRKALQEVAGIAKPDTILAWYRHLGPLALFSFGITQNSATCAALRRDHKNTWDNHEEMRAILRPILIRKPWEQAQEREGPSSLEALSGKTGGVLFRVADQAQAKRAAMQVAKPFGASTSLGIGLWSPVRPANGIGFASN